MAGSGHDWWNSIQNFLSQFGQPGQTPQRAPVVGPKQTVLPQQPTPSPQMGEQDIMGLIATAAKQYRLVMMLYNNHWRYAEPYSYRHYKTGMCLMAFCYRHQHIEAFKPGKIEAVTITEMGFRPRWPVEIGRS